MLSGPYDRKKAHDWMENFAGKVGLTLEQLIQTATYYVENGDTLIDGGEYEYARGLYYESQEAFWTHYQTLTGKEVREDDRGTPFCCTC